MSSGGRESGLRDLLALLHTRDLLRSRGAKALAVGIGVAYALISLYAGLMLEFLPEKVSGLTVQVLSNPYAQASWDYPALLVEWPGGILVLPYLATLSMIVVATGVGIGMGAGVVLASRLLSDRRAERSGAGPGTGAVSLTAGMTPAMIALLTLGACCSTSAAAAAGIGAVAQASGTTYDAVLANSWFLNVFQIAILGVALLAQEHLLAIFGDLSPQSTPERRRSRTPRDAPDPSANGRPTGALASSRDRDRSHAGTAERRQRWPRWVVGAFRALLLIAGTLWSLSVLIEWALPAAPGAETALVVGGILQRPFVGLTAVAAALFPAVLVTLAARPGLKGLVPIYRVLLLVCGLSLAVGVPPPLTGWGLAGLGNEVLGAEGVPASMGGARLPALSAPMLGLTWALFYALLGCFSILLALRPKGLLSLLREPELSSAVVTEATASAVSALGGRTSEAAGTTLGSSGAGEGGSAVNPSTAAVPSR